MFLWPIWYPTFPHTSHPISSAIRLASATTASLRGCVHKTESQTPASNKIWGTCEDLPQPVHNSIEFSVTVGVGLGAYVSEDGQTTSWALFE